MCRLAMMFRSINIKQNLSVKPILRQLKNNYSNKPSYKKAVGEDPLRKTTTGQLLEQTCARFGDRPAVISKHQNRSITFSQVLEEADRLAACFRKIGLEKGDRIGIWIPNLLEWYTIKLACARGGFVTAGLNPAAQPPEMEYYINKIGIKAIVCADTFKKQDYYEDLLKIEPLIESANAGSIKITFTDYFVYCSRGIFTFNNFLDIASQKDIDDVKNFQQHISCNDPYNIHFTSGTTGKPKAAVVSHFNVVNNSFFIGKRNEFHTKHHKICLQVPFFHAFGTVNSVMAALTYGATLVLPAEGFNPDKSLDAIRDERCTVIYGTPTMYVDLIERQEERQADLSSAEIAVCGGSICVPHLFKKMLSVLKVKKVKVRSLYGQTESTAVVFQSLPTDDEEKQTSTVGHVGEHIEAKVVDQNEHIVPCGTPGELFVKGYATMLGYWNDEEKTKETFTPDGWLKTGDQFVLREDGYGNVVGRLKEMIIRGGENIFPREIEEFLNTHPDILETYVIGLPHERLGEEVCACVRVKPGKDVTLQDVKNFCKGQLSYFKVPSKLKIVAEFPKTLSGKIQKYKLVAEATQDQSS